MSGFDPEASVQWAGSSKIGCAAAGAVQSRGALGVAVVGPPAAPPVVVSHGAGWIGIFGKAGPGFGGEIAFVVLPLSVTHWNAAAKFVVSDPPAASPVVVPDRT